MRRTVSGCTRQISGWSAGHQGELPPMAKKGRPLVLKSKEMSLHMVPFRRSTWPLRWGLQEELWLKDTPLSVRCSDSSTDKKLTSRSECIYAGIPDILKRRLKHPMTAEECISGQGNANRKRVYSSMLVKMQRLRTLEVNAPPFERLCCLD